MIDPARRGNRSGDRRPAASRKPVAAATATTVALAVALVIALVAVAVWVAGAPSPSPAPPAPVVAPSPPISTPPAPRATEAPRPKPPARVVEPEDEPEVEEPPEPAAPALEFATAWARGPTERARVERVVDGDTVALADGRRVRLLGINTPEKGEPLYEEAAATLRELVQGQEVTLEFDEERKDQYDRTLAYLFKGELFVNGELVRRGLAYCFTWAPNTAHEDDFISLQRDARAARRGLWALPAPAPEPTYVGDGRTRRFHRPSCRRVERIRERLQFRSRDEAFDAGQNPCGDCKP